MLLLLTPWYKTQKLNRSYMSDGVVKASKAQKPCDIYRFASSSLSPSFSSPKKAMHQKIGSRQKMGQTTIKVLD